MGGVKSKYAETSLFDATVEPDDLGLHEIIGVEKLLRADVFAMRDAVDGDIAVFLRPFDHIRQHRPADSSVAAIALDVDFIEPQIPSAAFQSNSSIEKAKAGNIAALLIDRGYEMRAGVFFEDDINRVFDSGFGRFRPEDMHVSEDQPHQRRSV